MEASLALAAAACSCAFAALVAGAGNWAGAAAEVVGTEAFATFDAAGLALPAGADDVACWLLPHPASKSVAPAASNAPRNATVSLEEAGMVRLDAKVIMRHLCAKE